ncbi:MAG: tetratricopeptide repeat protein [Bacteroidota bacterium]
MNYSSRHILLSSTLLFFAYFGFGQGVIIDSINNNAYQLYRKNVSEAKSLAYQAVKLSKEQSLFPQLVDGYVNLSRCYRIESNWDSAYLVLEEALEIGEQINYVEGLMNITNNLGFCLMLNNKNQEAVSYFKQTLRYANEINNYKGKANAFNNLFIIAEDEQKFDSAFNFLNRALEVYQLVGDSSGIARSYKNKAFLFYSRAQNDSAVYYNFKALRIQESQNLLYGQAGTRNQIGDLYTEKGQYQDALIQYKAAERLQEEIGDVVGLATTYSYIGYTLNELKKPDEALPYYEKSLEYSRKTEDPLLIGSALVDIANWYGQNRNELEKAKTIFEESVSYLEEAESDVVTAAFDGLGQLALRQNQLSEARIWFEKELKTAEEYEDLTGQKYGAKYLSEIYEMQGNSALAFKYLKAYQKFNDSLVNLESIETINQLNIEYETEKKEKENLILQNDLTQSKLDTAEQEALRNLILGIAAIVLLIGLGGFLWYRYRQRIRLKEQEMELEEERLRKEQRRKEAEKLRELDAMKTRFFTNISHEFRTPLTLILGQNEQVQSSLQDPVLKNRLEMVGRNGHRLLDLVNQVLDVAKIEAGGMELNIERLDAMPFLKHILYSFESMAEEKGINLIFESEFTQLDTAFDNKKIERVIFNLLSNAMKFTPAEGSIKMSVQRQADNLKINITDSGVGIKANQLPHIFDRFYQADSSESQAQPGTGIGLSLVKELVELHQGSIQVESELGQGTSFFISLPIPDDLTAISTATAATTLNPAALPSKTIANAEATLAEKPEAEQILLIEDNPDIRAFVKEQIISFGYKVHEAENGRLGLERAKEHIPDLIISDIMMPELDGYGVAKGMKEDERTSHIPLILLTSKASEESKIQGLELGIDDYLLKPFNSRELEVRMANLIEQRKRLRERFSTATVIRPNEVSAVPIEQTFIKKVLEIIENNLSNEQFSVEVLSEEVGMSVNNLNRKLKALIDQTAGKLIRSMRLQRAADLLKQKAVSISDIAYEMGFSSPNHFTRSFKKQFGLSPTEYQNQEA